MARFGRGEWNVANRLEQAPIVEPVHPFQGGELNGFLQAAEKGYRAAVSRDSLSGVENWAEERAMRDSDERSESLFS